MKTRRTSTLLILSVFSIAAAPEEINLVCTSPGKLEETATLDMGQKVVRHAGKRGNIGRVTADHIYYYTKQGRNIVSYRLDLGDGSLDIAKSKLPPEVGYEHARLVCRKQ